MQPAPRFNPGSVRDGLLARGGPREAGFIRYAYRPFDNRWLYWEEDTKLLDEKRAAYRPHIFQGNMWLSSSHRIRKGENEPQTAFTQNIASYHLIERVANWVPRLAPRRGAGAGWRWFATSPQPVSGGANATSTNLGWESRTCSTTRWRCCTIRPTGRPTPGALRMEWPRIPLPGWPDGDMPGAADELAASAAKGRELAALLDPEMPVAGGDRRGCCARRLAAIAVPSSADGRNMTGDDFELTVGWGTFREPEMP